MIKTKVTVKTDRGVESRCLGLKKLSVPLGGQLETTHRLVPPCLPDVETEELRC